MAYRFYEIQFDSSATEAASIRPTWPTYQVHRLYRRAPLSPLNGSCVGERMRLKIALSTNNAREDAILNGCFDLVPFERDH